MSHLHLLAIACALVPACTLAQVDATVDQVCLSYPDLEVSDVLAGSAIAQHFVFDDLAPLHQLLDYHAELQFVHAEVHTTSSDALAGIATASVDIASADPGSTLPVAKAYACDGDCVTPDASLELRAESVIDALAYLQSKSLAVDLAAAGQLPAHAWTMDVDVCMSAQVHYDVQP
jgi:hypothetical protein